MIQTGLLTYIMILTKLDQSDSGTCIIMYLGLVHLSAIDGTLCTVFIIGKHHHFVRMELSIEVTDAIIERIIAVLRVLTLLAPGIEPGTSE